MNSIQKLTEIFTHFPGIGPRQAQRFVYYLLTRQNGTVQELADAISELKKDISVCSECQRFYEKKNPNSAFCSICSDENRDKSILMIVPRDSDLESVEKNHVFNGLYFVLGGTVPILDKEPEKRIRIQELKGKMERSKNLKEIILGMNFTPEGENTGDYVRNVIKEIAPEIKISILGRGLSVGTELEYADSETIKNALKNRS
mgnify:CR=1 FL=1